MKSKLNHTPSPYTLPLPTDIFTTDARLLMPYDFIRKAISLLCISCLRIQNMESKTKLPICHKE